jgi:hypothetical protein
MEYNTFSVVQSKYLAGIFRLSNQGIPPHPRNNLSFSVAVPVESSGLPKSFTPSFFCRLFQAMQITYGH